METQKILAYAVCYVPTKKGKLFAGLKCETMAAFHNQSEAIAYCNSLNASGYLDELHIGYRVYPMHWIPKNITVQ